MHPNQATSQSPLVSNFCNNGVKDPNFCLKVLGSDPRSKAAKNAHDLEGLTIDLGSNMAKTVTNKCSALLRSEKDPNIKAALGSCTGAYGLLNLDFDSIREAVQSGGNIDKQGADARVAVLKCNHDFDDKKLTSPLADDNNNLLNFIQIILANAVNGHD
ncbi:putative invertase inhibitor [Lycium barbarum]|uniref:putative invertase inhibitor n=1 Tax=Lycium barbarum TaxID=112863 RepID=UPI00293F2CB3|nr:putative invertase inhibitor [Lycium barbarum]